MVRMAHPTGPGEQISTDQVLIVSWTIARCRGAEAGEADGLRNGDGGAHGAGAGAGVRRDRAGRWQRSGRAHRQQGPQAPGPRPVAQLGAGCQGRLRAGPAGGRDFPGPGDRRPGRPLRADGMQHGGGSLQPGRVLRHSWPLAGHRPLAPRRPGPHDPGGPLPARASQGIRSALRCCPAAAAPPSPRRKGMSARTLDELISQDYKHGFYSELETDAVPSGLSEEVIRLISAKKEEPSFMLEWRLAAFRHWLTMSEPHWASVHHPPINYQDIVYYSAPKSKTGGPKSLAEVDPELLRIYDKLGVPLQEREILAGVAVDAVLDSVSVATTFKEKLASLGIIFCAFSEAVREHPDLVKQYLGSVVPYTDNYFASLNSAVFSDGSFCYIPPGVRCPMELSTYFRINAMNTGQFERTLIIADKGAYVSYLEGCTAPMRDENQLHAAVVELVALDKATIKYSTVQNWYPGDKEGKGGIYNFVTKRGKCLGRDSKISWTQVETGSAITWKYPSCILQGENSVGEFYSVALTNNYQQADTGTKMIHIGKNTKSTIISKGISAGHGQNSYRGLVKIMKGAEGARNYSQCDSMLIGDKCGAHTFPYIDVRNSTAIMEHEASTSKIGEEKICFLRQRGLKTEDAVSMIVNGFCKQVFRELPMEFAVEAQKLLSVSLEGSVG